MVCACVVLRDTGLWCVPCVVLRDTGLWCVPCVMLRDTGSLTQHNTRNTPIVMRIIYCICIIVCGKYETLNYICCLRTSNFYSSKRKLLV